MKTKSLIRLVTLCALCALGMPRPAQAAQVNLVENGGFETGDFTGWMWSGNFENADAVVVGTYDEVEPYAGNWQAFLGVSGDIGWLEQSFAVTPGTTYQIEFWLQNLEIPPSRFEVKWDNELLPPALIDSDAFLYTKFSYGAVAAGPTATLSLGFQNDNYYFQLDDVSVERVPEAAATAGLLGLGLAGLAGMRRKLS